MLRFRILIASLLCAGMFCLAQAQVPMTGAGLGAPSSGGAFVYAYQATTSLGTWTGSTTWSGASLGTSTAAANRWVILYIDYSGPGAPINAVDANGTISFTQSILDSTNSDLAIWYANVPTGSSIASLNFHTSGGAIFTSNVWLATINGTSQTSPSSTGDYPAASPPGSITITVPTGGIAGTIFIGDGSTAGSYVAPAVSDVTGAVQNIGHDSTAGSQTIVCNFTSTTHAQGVAFAWGP